MESPHLEYNPIVCPINVKEKNPAAVINFDQKVRYITSEKDNLPIKDDNTFVRLLDSDSDNVKLEAASSL